MNIENTKTRNIAIVVSFFATALLLASIYATTAYAGANYDRGEKLKGFTYNHKTASESKAKKACDGKDKKECIDCIEHRADLQGLKGYEVVKCLKEPKKYNY